MNGCQLSFYTTQGRRLHGKQITQWLIDHARDIGIRGATVVTASLGYGHDRRYHSVHFFELADEPVIVVIVATDAEAAVLLERLNREDLDLFYVKAPVEFGAAGVNSTSG